MNTNLLRCLLCGVAIAFGAGCREAPEGDPQDKLPITGKPSDAPVELKAQWRQDYRYLLFVEMTQNATMNTRRGPGSMESSISQDFAINVSEGLRGGRNLEVQFKSLAVMSSFGDRVSVFYDSQNSVTTPQGQGVEALDDIIGAKLTVQLRRDGVVAGVDGMRELMAKVGGADSGRGRGFGMMQRYFSPQHFRQFVEFSGLPAKAVAIGESWPSKRDITGNMVGTLVMSTTNTFAGWQERQKRPCARIEIVGQIGLPGSPNRPADSDTSVTDGKVKGTMWLDPKLEFPVELSLEQTYTVVSSRQARGGRGGGTNAPASARAETTSSPVRQTLLFRLTEAAPGVNAPSSSPALNPKPAK